MEMAEEEDKTFNLRIHMSRDTSKTVRLQLGVFQYAKLIESKTPPEEVRVTDYQYALETKTWSYYEVAAEQNAGYFRVRVEHYAKDCFRQDPLHFLQVFWFHWQLSHKQDFHVLIPYAATLKRMRILDRCRRAELTLEAAYCGSLEQLRVHPVFSDICCADLIERLHVGSSIETHRNADEQHCRTEHILGTVPLCTYHYNVLQCVQDKIGVNCASIVAWYY